MIPTVLSAPGDAVTGYLEFMLEFDIENLLGEFALQRNTPVVPLEVRLQLQFGASGESMNRSTEDVAAEEFAVLAVVSQSKRTVIEVALQCKVARTVC